jgi:hypothetical protein
MVTLDAARRIATPTELGFSVMFGLQPQLAAALASLFAGQTVRTHRTYIARLRAALTAEAIDTTEAGYRLTEVGVGECEAALADFRDWVTSDRSAA